MKAARADAYMRRFSKSLFLLLGCLWLFISCILLYNKIYLAGERGGYERGLRQGIIYRSCKTGEPTEHFKREMWNLVNMPNDCRFVEAADSEHRP
jgi:hypothetical protein